MERSEMKPVESSSQPGFSIDRSLWFSAVLLLVIAGFLRFYQLDNQLWLDEISGLVNNYRKPFLEILTTYPGYVPHPLYALLAHGGLVLLGESPLAIRLPAALFGVAGVLMFLRLAWRLTSPGEALLASFLLAVSYHHIYYSQYARGYTLYIFFFLVTSDLLLSLLESMRWRTALAYAGMATLTAYSQPFGLFVLAGQMIVALPVAWQRRRKGDHAAPTHAHLIGVAALTSAAILVLYAPHIQGSITYSLTTSQTAGEGPRVFQLLPEILEGLRAAFGGWPIIILGAAVGGIGTLHFFRWQPLAAAVLLSPLLVGVGVLGALGVGLHPRWFLMALPVGYLFGTHGIVVITRYLPARVLPKSPVYSIRLQVIFAILLVIATSVPLARYYAFPKQDYLGAIQFVKSEAAEGDQFVAVDMAGHAIVDYYDPEFPVVETLPELLQVEQTGQRVWAITTLERTMADRDLQLLAHIHEEYQLVQILPGTVEDGAMRIYLSTTGSP